MPDDTMRDDSEQQATVADDAADELALEPEGEEAEPSKPPLNLEVKIDARGACQRHITVTIPREDINRYLSEAVSELMPKAAVPGFRTGRAPRRLVEARYRKEVGDQVKGSLLMDSMGQVSENYDLAPISEPDFDPVAIVLPDEGPMTFEFDIEVRPEFDVPNWKGLRIDRPVRDFTDADIDVQLKDLLSKHGSLVPFDGPAAPGDYLSLNMKFRFGEEEISSVNEEVIRIRPVLSFRDGKVPAFDKLMTGARAGETRTGKAQISPDAPNAKLRGQEITAIFEVLEVKKLELPSLTPAFLDELGGFESEQALRTSIRGRLERRLQYAQQQRARQQILLALTVAANWELPPELLQRQYRRELERSVMELQRSGFGDDEIRAHENELRQNSRASTERALKEHFILERIAEAEGIADAPEDYDAEIELIAAQSGESARRVRAQIEKRNLMDVLRNQIIERKTINLILAHANFREIPFEMEAPEAEAVDQSAAGGDEAEQTIPEAQYPDAPESKLP